MIKDGKCIGCDRSVHSSGEDSGPPILIAKKKKEKLTREEKKMDIIQKLQKRNQMEKDHYPEIKIPNEFIVKFEFDKDLPPGTATSGPRELRDEIIIRYL